MNSVFRDIHGPCTPYFDQRALAGCGARILARRCTSLTLQYSPSLQTLVWYPRRASASALFHSTYTTRGNWPFFPIILCASTEFTLTHRSAFHLDGLRSRRYSLELIRAVAQPTSDRDPSPGAGPATAPLHLIWWHLAVTSEAEGQHLKVVNSHPERFDPVSRLYTAIRLHFRTPCARKLGESSAGQFRRQRAIASLPLPSSQASIDRLMDFDPEYPLALLNSRC